MLKVAKTFLALIMLIGSVVAFIFIILGKLKLIIGLPLFVFPMALALVYFFPQHITMSKTNTEGLFLKKEKLQTKEDSNISFNTHTEEISEPATSINSIPNNNISNDVSDSKYIRAESSENFYNFLLNTIEVNYYINIEEQIGNVLVFNKQNPNYDAILNTNLNYVIHHNNNKVAMVINLYHNENKKQKMQLANLFNKAEIPLLTLHKGQEYSEKELTRTIIATLSN